MKDSIIRLVLCLPALLPFNASAEDEDAVTVAVLMFDGVQIIDFAAPYEVFGQAGFKVFTVSSDGKPVDAVMGLGVEVDYDFASAPDADILMLPGGNTHEVSRDEQTLAFVRKHSTTADHVMSVCTGSFIIAGSGLLDGKQATTFHNAFDHMADMFPKVEIVRDQRWVDAGKVVTSAGLASGIDTALHVVAQVKGMNAAKSVALHLEYDWHPERGFVRGRMADQFIRMPEGGTQFPEGTVVDEQFSIGDDHYWETEYRVITPWTAKEFMMHIRERAKQDTALHVLALPDKEQLAWEYMAKRGGEWRFSADVTDKRSANDFTVVTKVIRLD